MHTTIELLDELKQRHGITSDYGLHKLLGVTRAHISHYRHGRSAFSDEIGLKVAALLELPPAYVFACIAAERTRTDGARQVWEQLAKKLSGVSAAVFVALLLSPSDAPAAAPGRFVASMYYVKRLRQFAQWLAARLSAHAPVRLSPTLD